MTASTFEDWMEAVDKVTKEIVGCSIHDLPDCTFMDWYTDGMSAREAAKRAIRYANDEDE